MNINDIPFQKILSFIVSRNGNPGQIEDFIIDGDKIVLKYDGEWKKAYVGSVEKNIISDFSQNRPKGGPYNFIKSYYNLFEHQEVLEWFKEFQEYFDGKIDFNNSFSGKSIKKELLQEKEYNNEEILQIYNFILKNKEKFRLTNEVLEKLSERGIKEKTILKEGWFFGTLNLEGKFYKDKIIIPIKNGNREVIGLKLRDLFTEKEGFRKEYKSISVKGSSTGLIYNETTLVYDNIYLQEGEMDYLILKQLGFKNILSNTGGVMAFQKDWLNLMKNKTLYIMYDNDSAGQKGVDKIKNIIETYKQYGIKNIYQFKFGKKGEDINDIYLRLKETGLSDRDIQKKIKKGFKKIF